MNQRDKDWLKANGFVSSSLIPYWKDGIELWTGKLEKWRAGCDFNQNGHYAGRVIGSWASTPEQALLALKNKAVLDGHDDACAAVDKVIQSCQSGSSDETEKEPAEKNDWSDLLQKPSILATIKTLEEHGFSELDRSAYCLRWRNNLGWEICYYQNERECWQVADCNLGKASDKKETLCLAITSFCTELELDEHMSETEHDTLVGLSKDLLKLLEQEKNDCPDLPQPSILATIKTLEAHGFSESDRNIDRIRWRNNQELEICYYQNALLCWQVVDRNRCQIGDTEETLCLAIASFCSEWDEDMDKTARKTLASLSKDLLKLLVQEDDKEDDKPEPRKESEMNDKKGKEDKMEVKAGTCLQVLDGITYNRICEDYGFLEMNGFKMCLAVPGSPVYWQKGSIELELGTDYKWRGHELRHDIYGEASDDVDTALKSLHTKLKDWRDKMFSEPLAILDHSIKQDGSGAAESQND